MEKVYKHWLHQSHSNAHRRLQCVLCEKKLGNESLKMNKLYRHLQRNHFEHRGKSKEFFCAKKRLSSDSVLTAQHIQNCIYIFYEVVSKLTLHSAKLIIPLMCVMYWLTKCLLPNFLYVLIFRCKFMVQVHHKVVRNLRVYSPFWLLLWFLKAYISYTF